MGVPPGLVHQMEALEDAELFEFSTQHFRSDSYVLTGEMSLIGPRPIAPSHLERYGDYASLFLSVKPGLTGSC